MVARDWPRADLIRNQTGGSTGDADHVLPERRPEVLAGGGDAAAQPLGRLGGRRPGRRHLGRAARPARRRLAVARCAAPF